MEKEKNKLLLTFIITAITFLSIGVFASNILYSKDILYTPTNSKVNSNNVQDALDTLYNNYYKPVNKQLFVGHGTATDVLTDSIYSKYTYLKIINIQIFEGEICDVFFQNDNGTIEMPIELNKEYNLKNLISSGYVKFSARSTDGWCWPKYTFYN